MKPRLFSFRQRSSRNVKSVSGGGALVLSMRNQRFEGYATWAAGGLCCSGNTGQWMGSSSRGDDAEG